MLCVQFCDNLHSSDESLVDDVEGVPLFECLHDNGSNGLEPHVHDFLGNLVEDRVGGEHLLCHLLRSGLDLEVDIVALQNFAEVCTFAAKHFNLL